MPGKKFSASLAIHSDTPSAIRPLLEKRFGAAAVRAGERAGEFLIIATLEGATARDLNRDLLSELRRAEKRTRLRSEWTAEGVTERFFDYVSKGSRRT